MTNQEVFNWLSVLESETFYAQRDISGAEDVHDHIRAALIRWHELTGCTNGGTL